MKETRLRTSRTRRLAVTLAFVAGVVAAGFVGIAAGAGSSDVSPTAIHWYDVGGDPIHWYD